MAVTAKDLYTDAWNLRESLGTEEVIMVAKHVGALHRSLEKYMKQGTSTKEKQREFHALTTTALERLIHVEKLLHSQNFDHLTEAIDAVFDTIREIGSLEQRPDY